MANVRYIALFQLAKSAIETREENGSTTEHSFSYIYNIQWTLPTLLDDGGSGLDWRSCLFPSAEASSQPLNLHRKQRVGSGDVSAAKLDSRGPRMAGKKSDLSWKVWQIAGSLHWSRHAVVTCDNETHIHPLDYEQCTVPVIKSKIVSFKIIQRVGNS